MLLLFEHKLHQYVCQAKLRKWRSIFELFARKRCSKAEKYRQNYAFLLVKCIWQCNYVWWAEDHFGLGLLVWFKSIHK